jgi:hypothetical protein
MEEFEVRDALMGVLAAKGHMLAEKEVNMITT